MVPGLRLLVVDEQVDHRAAEALRHEGFSVRTCVRATDALVELGRHTPDVLLLSPRLPDLDVSVMVEAVRRAGDQPILLGVGHADDVEQVGRALLAGATATVSRPYEPAEVAGKLGGALARTCGRAPLAVGPLRLDPLAHTVHIGAVEVTGLGLKDFRLLEILMDRADRVVSHREVRDALGDGTPTRPSGNAVAVHVRRIRSRLPAPLQLRTVRGLGYRLTIDQGAQGP